MKYIYGLSLALVLCLVGCGDLEQQDKAEIEKPPPLTATKIHSDYKKALDPLFKGSSANAPFGKGAKNAPIAEFRTVRGQMSAEINEPEAKEKLEKDVERFIDQAKDNEQWFAVDGLLDVYQILRPDSQVYSNLRRRAELMMARPVVRSTGFVAIGDEELICFLDITNPMTGDQDTFKVREGEEFYEGPDGKMGLKLIRVIGAQSALELEYLALPGYTWEIPGPKND